MLCELLGIDFHPDPPRACNSRGCGHMMLDSSLIICSWTLFVQDLSSQPVDLTFDLTDDESSITIGLNTQRYSKSNFVSAQPIFNLMKPQDRSPRTLPLYISMNDPRNIRARLDVSRLRPARVYCAMSVTSFGSLAWPTNCCQETTQIYTHTLRGDDRSIKSHRLPK